MTPLYRQLHEWAKRPFVWGENDCILSLCDWILDVRGFDPALHVRGTYDSRGSCHRETGFFRDPVGVVDRHFQAAGDLPMKDVPAVGDVALIQFFDRDARLETFGALWLGSAWGCKGPSGTTTLAPQMVRVLAIWGVGYAP